MDTAQFEREIITLKPRLWGWALGFTRESCRAEDLVQTTILKAWPRIESFDPARSALSTWLWFIMRNANVDEMRKKIRGMRVAYEQLLDSPPVTTFDEESLDLSKIQLIHRAMGQLRPKHEYLLRAHYYQGKTHRHLAAELNQPLGTIKSNIRRAHQALQAILEDIERPVFS